MIFFFSHSDFHPSVHHAPPKGAIGGFVFAKGSGPGGAHLSPLEAILNKHLESRSESPGKSRPGESQSDDKEKDKDTEGRKEGEEDGLNLPPCLSLNDRLSKQHYRSYEKLPTSKSAGTLPSITNVSASSPAAPPPISFTTLSEQGEGMESEKKARKPKQKEQDREKEKEREKDKVREKPKERVAAGDGKGEKEKTRKGKPKASAESPLPPDFETEAEFRSLDPLTSPKKTATSSAASRLQISGSGYLSEEQMAFSPSHTRSMASPLSSSQPITSAPGLSLSSSSSKFALPDVVNSPQFSPPASSYPSSQKRRNDRQSESPSFLISSSPVPYTSSTLSPSSHRLDSSSKKDRPEKSSSGARKKSFTFIEEGVESTQDDSKHTEIPSLDKDKLRGSRRSSLTSGDSSDPVQYSVVGSYSSRGYQRSSESSRNNLPASSPPYSPLSNSTSTPFSPASSSHPPLPPGSRKSAR
eukprot:GILI01011439.1.p1 GENE.GILI01011439.1~~GILI01011439.1.p1  ORF type:complete len:470 (+),score=81.95 GILI01011439.1:3-1412(+)